MRRRLRVGCFFVGLVSSSCFSSAYQAALRQQRASIIGVGHGFDRARCCPASPSKLPVRCSSSAGGRRHRQLGPLRHHRPASRHLHRHLRAAGIQQVCGVKASILEGAFAAQVNASLSVGAVEETVTVTGASPVVDVQSTQNQAVLNRDVLDVLPAARTMQGGASLVPGVSFYSQGFRSKMSVHGSLRAGSAHLLRWHEHRAEPDRHGQQANGVGVNELAQTELVYDAGIAVGRERARRRAHGLDSEGRRQQLLRRLARRVRLEWRAAGRQHHRRAATVHLDQGTSSITPTNQRACSAGPIKKDHLWFLVAQRVPQTNNLIPLLTAVLPARAASRSPAARSRRTRRSA